MIRHIAALAAAGFVMFIGAVEPAAAQETITCAPEGGYCRVPYPTTVIYGRRGRVTSREVGPRGIPCSNEAFGDPAPGVVKRCSYVVRDRPRRRY